jgi:hypothetical protein
MVPPCSPGNIDQLADDFADDDLNDALWWSYDASGTSLTEVGGEIVLDYADGSSANNAYAGLYSQQNYDLRGCALSIEVREMMTATTNGEFYFVATRPDSNGDDQLLFYFYDGQMWFSVREGGVKTEASVGYDAVEHRFWRIREQGGTVHLETSSDGVSFDVQHSETTPGFVNSVQVVAEGGTWAPVAAPGVVRLDNLNVVP